MVTRREVLGVAALAVTVGPRTARVARAQDDAQTLLTRAADAMAALKSFHFQLETVDGRSTIYENLELNKVVGDVVRPASFQATMTAKVAVIEVNVQVISIDGSVWVSDPLKAELSWQQVASVDEGDSAAGSFTDLINPDRLFLQAVGLMDEAEIDGNEEIDGINTTVVTGVFDPARLIDLASPVAGEAESDGLSGILTGEPVYLTVWIADDGKVIRIEEEGPLTQSESDDVIRQIDFSAFDEPVEIVAPEVTE